ncbi:hypothetical protein FEM03_01595 [Phragmitibacter flavus]|uniref:Uncharacterized protein n=1 Tax=Phragmitibacter flavus TaxID=2576071 RepID=A0A5R8KKN7_9BACT|nr:hypothetical protein [Phragmitibacter flavus]TLD72791.1 hypothetical protein FEM03_01595 [Phragmitibacter flavus]
MSLTLNHFRKEARYHLPLWLSWLALVLLDLMLNLEWFAPLQENTREAWWTTSLPILTWGLVFWLGAAHAPEDSPANPNRFLATRPIHPYCYWFARFLVLLLYILPLTIVEALYLVGSNRPSQETLGSTVEQALVALALFTWLLPFSALWKQREGVLALGVIAFVCWVGLMIADSVVLSTSRVVNARLLLHNAGILSTIAIFCVLSIMLSQWKKWPSLRLPFRLGLTSLLTLGLLALAVAWPLSPRGSQPVANDLLPVLAASIQPTIPEENVVFKFGRQEGQSVLWPRLTPDFQKLPSNVQISSANLSLNAQQSGKPLAINLPSYLRASWIDTLILFPENGKSDRALASLFPPGTLLTESQKRFGNDTGALIAGQLSEPLPDLNHPLTIVGKWQLDWYEWQKILDIPLANSSDGGTNDHHWKILRVHLNHDAQGKPETGSVSITLHHAWNPANVPALPGFEGLSPPQKIVLYSPDRRIAWTQPSESVPQPTRAALTHWQKKIVTFSWKNILNYKDGSPASADPERLRLQVVRRDFLGSTLWQWESPELIPKQHMDSNQRLSKQEFVFPSSRLYADRELESFKQQTAALRIPSAHSSREEVSTYLAELLIRASTVNAISRKNSRPAYLQALGPIAQNHLEVLLDLPKSALEKARISGLIGKHLDQKRAEWLINRIPDQPEWIETIKSTPWLDNTSRLAPELVKTKRRLDPSLTDLMLSWNDPAVDRRLVEEIRQHPNIKLFDGLAQRSTLLPQLNTVANELFATSKPVLQDYSTPTRLSIAARQGNADALDLALLFASMSAEIGSYIESYQVDQFLPELASLINLPFDKSMRSYESLVPQFRNLRASEFQYLPSERRWERLNQAKP